MKKYLQLENVVRIITLLVSFTALFSFLLFLGFFKKKPEIETTFKSPVRVLNYDNFKNKYLALTNDKLPDSLTIILDENIKNAEKEIGSNYQTYQRMLKVNTFYEELSFGINSEQYFNKKYNTKNKLIKFLENIRVPTWEDAGINTYKERMGINTINTLSYESLLETPPWGIGLRLTVNPYKPIPANAINVRNMTNILTKEIDNIQFRSNNNSASSYQLTNRSALYKALFDSSSTYSIVIFKNVGKSSATNIKISIDLRNIYSGKLFEFVSSNTGETLKIKKMITREKCTKYIGGNLYECPVSFLRPSEFIFGIIESKGQFPIKDNFSIKYDITESLDKSSFNKAIFVSILLVLILIFVDYVISKKTSSHL